MRKNQFFERWYNKTSPKFRPNIMVYGIHNNKVVKLQVLKSQCGIMIKNTGLPEKEWERYECGVLDDSGEVVDTISVDGADLFLYPEDIISKFVK